MERAQAREDGPAEPGREAPLDRVPRRVDLDLLLKRNEAASREVVSGPSSKREERKAKEEEGRTHAWREYTELPVEAVHEAGREAPAADDDDVEEEAGADVEVARHDALGREGGDRLDLVGRVRVEVGVRVLRDVWGGREQ